MSLTKKQEAFIAKYLECDNATAAYKHAYDTKNMKEATIGNNAYMLLKKHSEVAARIKEIKDKVLDKIVIDRIFLTNGILDTIEKADLEGDRSNTLKGYDMLGKMYDLNEDKQNDRLMSNKDRVALINNFKRRLLDVTPEE